jgi:hypothetical protein
MGQTLQGGFPSDFIAQWNDFRVVYPYHIQTIALSSSAQDGHRLLLLAEPPPHVTLARLRELDSAAFATSLEERHPIGADGWTKDLLVDLPPMDNQELHSLLDSVADYLFQTSYKSNVISLPVPAGVVSHPNLDLRVSAADLKRALLSVVESTGQPFSFLIIMTTVVLAFLAAWLFYIALLRRWIMQLRHPARLRILSSAAGIALALLFCLTYRFWPSLARSDNSFVSVNGGEPVSARQILEGRQSGVFMSSQPGIVLWSFDRTKPLSGSQAEFRQFALDSDLLLGAIRGGDQVLVIARERSVSLDLLPPLRSETMVLLSSAGTNELAQSYERTQLLAGTLMNGSDPDFQHDWAPIYLSDQLINTEYGSLLNITDQLLKSWSMHGEVKYTGFHYPPPGDFPFKDALSRLVGTHTLLFNWNTKGAGYILQDNPYDIYALNRTGALPIDYRAAGNARLEENEDTAYDRFAGYSDPNLVRVVQYAALYQIFRQFQVAPSALKFQHASSPPLVKLQTQRVLQWLMSSEPVFKSVLESADIDDNDRAQLLQLRNDLTDASQKIGFPALLAFTVDRQSLDFQSIDVEDPKLLVEELSDIDMELYGLQDVIQGILDLDVSAVKNAYLSQSQEDDSGWIHTPSVVISWQEGGSGPRFVGGHNLSDKVSVFRSDPALHAGEVRIEQDPQTGQQIIEHSPSDTGKIADLVRETARHDPKSPDSLQKKIEDDLERINVSNHDLRVELNVDSRPKPDFERGFQPVHSPGAVNDVGWRLSSQSVPSRQASLLQAIQTSAVSGVVISRQPNGTYYVAHKSSPHPIEASNLPAAIDAAKSCVLDNPNGNSNINLLLTGFEERQGRSFARSLELHLGDEKQKTISIAIEGQPIEPRELERVFNGDYDYLKTTIQNLSDPFTEPDGRISVTADMKLQAWSQSLIVRIKMFFRENFPGTAKLASAIADAVSRWQSAIASMPGKIHFLIAHKLLLRELKKVDPYLDRVHTTISIEGKDLYASEWNSKFICGDECHTG